MSVFQPVERLQHQRHGGFGRDLPDFFDQVGHAAAFAVFERHEEAALRITHIAQFHDVAMPQHFRVGGLAHDKMRSL